MVTAVVDVPIDQQQVSDNHEILTMPELSNIERVNNLLLDNIIAVIQTTSGDVDIDLLISRYRIIQCSMTSNH